MHRFQVAAIILLIFSVNVTLSSDPKFKKLSFNEKITHLTGFPAPVAAMISAYFGFFKIVRSAGRCYDSKHEKNRSYLTFNEKLNCIQRSCFNLDTHWKADTTTKVFHSYFYPQTLLITHAKNPENVSIVPVLQQITITKETTKELQCIAGEEIIPPGSIALIVPDRSKLVVFDPRSNWDVSTQCAAAQLPEAPNEFDPRIFVYTIYNDDKNPTNTSSSCCSVS